jgi:YidC/Oxa1 family membrane protein insertase
MKKMQSQMQKVQPKITAIKTRYKKKGLDFQSRQNMNQEIMGLYKKEGINPMGSMTGCLPLLLQLPILWAFYNVLRAAVELRQAPFILWINDLSAKDPYLITPILMGATMLIQQVMSGPMGGDPFQRRMMYMMPIIFTFLFLGFPSGLVLYWLVNNVLAIGQQYLINKQAKKLIESEKNSKGKAKSKGQ